MLQRVATGIDRQHWLSSVGGVIGKGRRSATTDNDTHHSMICFARIDAEEWIIIVGRKKGSNMIGFSCSGDGNDKV